MKIGVISQLETMQSARQLESKKILQNINLSLYTSTLLMPPPSLACAKMQNCIFYFISLSISQKTQAQRQPLFPAVSD